MSRMTTLHEAQALIEFARKAALFFAEDEQHSTYGDVQPGALLALRWGMGNDCVLVTRLDENFEPVNFQNAVIK